MHCKLVELDASLLCREGSAGLMVGTFVLKEEAALRKMQEMQKSNASRSASDLELEAGSSRQLKAEIQKVLFG